LAARCAGRHKRRDAPLRGFPNLHEQREWVKRHYLLENRLDQWLSAFLRWRIFEEPVG
jgi:hypothetical protein